MDVIRAETAGFCMGVNMALNKLDALVEGGQRPIFILGPIIHNPQVLEEYARKGVLTAQSPDEIPAGAHAVIRAHGIPKQVEQRLRERGVQLIDATCPKVKKAQLLIEKHAHPGCTLLLYGEVSHPEVKGLLSYAQAGAYVFETKEQFDQFPLKAGETYCLAAQTTQDKDIFEQMAKQLSRRPDLDIEVLRTICDATKQRQEEALRVARKVDFMVVVGGKESGNTRRLAQVVAAQNTPCIHVETAAELQLDTLGSYGRIGLTAGASTPKTIIDEVYAALKGRPKA